MTKPPPAQTTARRALPPARPSNRQFEIVQRRRSAPASLFGGLFAALRGGLGWSGEVASDAYAAAARTVIERKEAIEDRNAERRHRFRAAADASPAAESGRASSPVSAAELQSGD